MIGLLERWGVVLVAAFFLGVALKADEAAAFFDDSFVHEVRLTFEESDWYRILYDSHSTDPDDPYFSASFVADGVRLPDIGVRFKGNSSFVGDSIKKSFKLDFNEFDKDARFFGLKKLNLNNGFNDPSLLREKLFLDFAAQFVPAIRAVHTRVYVNDEYMGLYIAVEQVDKTFIQDRFGDDEDGNLYKAAAKDGAGDDPQDDFGSDLVWLGREEALYHDHYQLKTNEKANDYSGLVEFVNVLNNRESSTFSDTLEPLLDVDNVLKSLALNSLFMNLDSYSGSAHNYYLYQSDSSGLFSYVLWDLNESFGTFLRLWTEGDPREADPFWIPHSEPRPLMEKLWANPDYARRYVEYYAGILRSGFDLDTMKPRIKELAGLIRTDVYADENKFFTNSNFERNLERDVGRFLGLESFVEGRASYLKRALSQYEFELGIRQFPKFEFDEKGVSLNFEKLLDGVEYIVESSTDVNVWSTEILETDNEGRSVFSGSYPESGMKLFRFRVVSSEE